MIRDYNGYAMKWAKKEVKDASIDTCFTVASLIKKVKKTRLKTLISILEPIFYLFLLVLVTAFLIDESYSPFLYFRF